MWQRGTIEKIDYTAGGAGNQWTTIGGTRYATWFDWNTFSSKEGLQIEFWPYKRALWHGSEPTPCAKVRNCAPLTSAIETIETGLYKVLPWFAFRQHCQEEQNKLHRAEGIIAASYPEIRALAESRKEYRPLSEALPLQHKHYAALKPLWVLFDQEPANDRGGFMLIGEDPEALARECIQHFELEEV